MSYSETSQGNFSPLSQCGTCYLVMVKDGKIFCPVLHYLKYMQPPSQTQCTVLHYHAFWCIAMHPRQSCIVLAHWVLFKMNGSMLMHIMQTNCNIICNTCAITPQHKSVIQSYNFRGWSSSSNVHKMEETKMTILRNTKNSSPSI